MAAGMEPVQPDSPSTQSATTSIKKNINDGQSLPSSPGPVQRPRLQPSFMSSSPPPSTGGSERAAESFKMTLGATPTRHQLAEMMGVDYNDRVQKQYLRARLKEIMVLYLDMKNKVFTELDFVNELWPVIKLSKRRMNREFLAGRKQWTRSTVFHVMHSIFEDSRRNAGSKLKSAAKRREKRALGVRLHILLIPLSHIWPISQEVMCFIQFC